VRFLEINLATRPFRNNTLYWAGFGSAALVLTVLTGVNLWLFFRSGTSVQQYAQEIVLKRQKRDALSRDEQRLGVKLTKLDFGGLREEAEFANDAIRRRVFSWTELFNRLEEVVPPSVMMSSLRPEIQAEGISVVAEGFAKDQEGLLDFEENLIRSAYFTRIYPGSERREQQGADLHFSLKFDYLPAGRPDAPPAPAKKTPSPEQQVASDSVPEPKVDSSTPSRRVEHSSGGIDAGGTAPGKAKAVVAPPPVTPAMAPPVGVAAGASVPVQRPPAPTGTATGSPRLPSPAPGVPRANLPGAKKSGRPAGRPMLRAGMVGGGIRIEPGPGASAEEEKRRAEAAAAGNFVDKPLEDVIEYLMKNRSMTFIFDGSFDLRQRVTMDVYDKEQMEIANLLAEKLGALVSMSAENTWRVSPQQPPDSLEEPPVEEEEVPDDSQEAEPPPEDGG